MTREALNYMKSFLESIGLKYDFKEWNDSEVPHTYWIGDYVESENSNEYGLEEATFMLTGTTDRNFLELEKVKEEIKNIVSNEGKTDILPSGSGIAIIYTGAQPLPSVEYGTHRLQIDLKIKEWRC